MKGLILKELYMVKSYCKMHLLLLLGFGVLGILDGENAFFLLYPAVMAGTIPMTLLAYDAHPATSALAAVTAKEFVAAVMYAALTGSYEPEPLPEWAEDLLEAAAAEEAAPPLPAAEQEPPAPSEG